MSDMNNHTTLFSQCLSRQRRVWQMGLLIQIALRVAGWIVMLAVIAVALDYGLALESAPRLTLALGAAILLAVRGVLGAIQVLHLGDREMATRADEAAHSRRRTVLSALELLSWLRSRPVSNSGTGLPSFLVSRSVENATTALRALDFRQYFPLGGVARQSRILLAQCLSAFVILGAHADASRTILSRWAFPTRDIPPYSRLVFTVQPAHPEVLYGGTADIAVTLSGAPVRQGVWFMTRSGGARHRVPCFQETETRFAQRLEKVTAPIEFCFASGKARSRWHPVTLLLDPRISLAAASIQPPPYSRQPRRQFVVGQEELIGLRQSEVELTIGSNRPLQDGRLTIRPLADTGPGTVIEGVRTGPRSLTFRWTLNHPAELDVSIRDLMGTRNIDPFRIQQKLALDQPPVATFTTPPGFALATPAANLSLAGQVEDDFGLGRVDLIRTVAGYRDRSRPLPLPPGGRQFQFTEALDLKALGVEPGQVLEFYIEAIDSNPDLTGIGMSEIVRVQIVSEDEYAAMLRARISLEEFLARYRVVATRLGELKAALQTLQDSAANPATPPAEREQALARARAATREAARVFDQAAKDFPAFDIERSLVASMASLAARSREWAGQLDAAAAADPGLAGMASHMLESLGQQAPAVQQQREDAEKLAALARVMESAMHLRQLATRQEDLVRRLSRFEKEARAAELQTLPSLGARQEEIRADLLAWKTNLAERISHLAPDYTPLRKTLQTLLDRIGEQDIVTSDEFNEALQNYEIPGLMGRAAQAAARPEGPPTHRYASLALERIQSILGRPEDDPAGNQECKDLAELFRRLAQGQGAGNKPCGPGGLQSTFNQLVQSLLMKGSGQNGPMLGLGGSGSGGSPESGYWMSGQSMLNVPAYGPGRTTMLQAPGMAQGSGSGQSGAGGPGVAPRQTENMNVPLRQKAQTDNLPLESLPDKYRNAVRRYFSTQ